MFEKNLNISLLLDFYGDILTNRQNEMLYMYYNEDFSLAEIAEKFERRRQMLSEKKGAQQPSNKVAILSRYVSILAVGQKKDINQLLNYTVYQLFDEFNRFELKSSYDIYLQAKMAGAQDLKEVEDWMKDIH